MNAINLTSFIAEPRTLKVLNDNFVNPVKRANATLVINFTKRVNAGGVGTAYDYWFRCALRSSQPGLLESFIGYDHLMSWYGKHSKARKAWKIHASTFSKLRDGSLKGKDKLFAACLFIAKFEAEFRSGYPVETFSVPRKDLNELKRIAGATDLERFRKESLVLNPVFSLKGSRLLIQGDGDIIVDGVLIDLKTSSILRLKENIRQLIGYWALNELSPKPHKIERLGVYYPRFGYYVEFMPSELMTNEQQGKIKMFFRRKLGGGIKIPKN